MAENPALKSYITLHFLGCRPCAAQAPTSEKSTAVCARWHSTQGSTATAPAPGASAAALPADSAAKTGTATVRPFCEATITRPRRSAAPAEHSKTVENGRVQPCGLETGCATMEGFDPTRELDGGGPVSAQPCGHEQRIDQDLGQVRGHARHDGQAAGRGAELREHGHRDRQRFLAADEHHRASHADRCAQGAGGFRECMRICFPSPLPLAFHLRQGPANTGGSVRGYGRPRLQGHMQVMRQRQEKAFGVHHEATRGRVRYPTLPYRGHAQDEAGQMAHCSTGC